VGDSAGIPWEPFVAKNLGKFSQIRIHTKAGFVPG
jgi:hypothetical protein